MTKFTFYCEFHIISGDAIGQIQKWVRDEPGAHVHFISACLACVAVKKESRFIQFWNWNDKVYILLRIPYNFRWCDWANRKVSQRRTRSPCPFYFCLSCLCRVKKESGLNKIWNWNDNVYIYCEFHIISGDAIGQIEKWVRANPEPMSILFLLALPV